MVTRRAANVIRDAIPHFVVVEVARDDHFFLVDRLNARRRDEAVQPAKAGFFGLEIASDIRTTAQMGSQAFPVASWAACSALVRMYSIDINRIITY